MNIKGYLLRGSFFFLASLGVVYFIYFVLSSVNYEARQRNADQAIPSISVNDQGKSQRSIIAAEKERDEARNSKDKTYAMPPNMVRNTGQLAASPGNEVPGIFGMTAEQLRTLHKKQEEEICLSMMNSDEIIIPPSEDGSPGVTRGELNTLHEQQERAIKMSASNPDEIVIPPSEDGSPGVTRGELNTLHEQQERAIKMSALNPDEIAIPPSEDGSPGVTRGELDTLHEQQEHAIKISAMDLDEIVIPPSEEGTPGVARWQLLDLHEVQEEKIGLKKK